MKASTVRPALVLFLLMTVGVGIVYPLIVTAIARLAFPDAATGSLILRGGSAVGSTLIGQNFSRPGYFWGRPSATTPYPYNATGSTGSNLGPLNPALTEAVKERIAALRTADPGNAAPVPVDLVTASASGLDPEVSVAAIEFQLPRVARARGMPEETVRRLARAHTQGRTFGFLGEPRVNVMQLNLALDTASAAAAR